MGVTSRTIPTKRPSCSPTLLTEYTTALPVLRKSLRKRDDTPHCNPRRLHLHLYKSNQLHWGIRVQYFPEGKSLPSDFYSIVGNQKVELPCAHTIDVKCTVGVGN